MGLAKVSMASLLWDILQDGSFRESGTTGRLAALNDICQRPDGDNSFGGICWELKQKASQGWGWSGRELAWQVQRPWVPSMHTHKSRMEGEVETGPPIAHVGLELSIILHSPSKC